MWYDGNNAIEDIGVNFLPETCAFDKNDANGFIINVKERNLLPLDKLQIYYMDDFWDFSGYQKNNTSISHYHFDFSNAKDCFKDELKNYVLICVVEGRKKINVIKANFTFIHQLLDYCYEKGVTHVKDIEAEHIKGWIENHPNHLSVRYMNIKVQAIKAFCEYYDANFLKTFNEDFYREINSIVDSTLVKAEAENCKTEDIPSDYFDKTLAAAIQTIDDKEAPVYYRALSCMLLMESQVGLRAGELFDLRVGCVKPVSIATGDVAYYLEYKTWKRHHGTKISSAEISYVNELFKKGYDAIIQLSKDKRKELNSDCLFVESKGGTATKFPVPSESVSVHMNNLFVYYDKYFPTVYNEPQIVDNLSCSSINTKRKDSTQYVVRPTITQFRVHMCSDLYAKGCPIEYIEKFMSHLSAEMAYYYVRPKNSVQENLDEATRVLKELVTKESIPIGVEKGLVEKIDEFIVENKMSVEKDLDAICAKLADRIPIRVKTGGVCIKSSRFRECSKDAVTDEFYCAYGVCPNIYTFYYMADLSYAQIKELCEAIDINRKKGCVKQVQKNIHMVQTILRNKLIPQIDELKRMMATKGLDHVLERHPQMTDIVVNLPRIEKEIDEWKSMSA